MIKWIKNKIFKPKPVELTSHELFLKSIPWILKWEGGYVNDPHDRGGETKYGISKRKYPNLDIKNLTKEKAIELYEKDFWYNTIASKLKWPACLAAFNIAINSGSGRLSKYLQSVKDPESMSPDALSDYLISSQEDFYYSLARVNPSQKRFLKGWLNRTNDLKAFIKANK